jgi:hypothetical protein
MILGIAIASAVFIAVVYLLYATRPPTAKGLPAQVLTRAIDGKEHHRENPGDDSWVPVVSTLYEAFKRGYVMNPSAPFLGFRQADVPGKPYKWLTYEQVLELHTIEHNLFYDKSLRLISAQFYKNAQKV